MNNEINLNELNALYDQRVREYQQNQQIRNRLEASRDFNASDFKKKYDSLPKDIIRILGLELTKDIKEYDIDELRQFSQKLEQELTSVYGKIKAYLTNGNISDLGNLVEILDVPSKESQQEVPELPSDTESALTDTSLITNKVELGGNSIDNLISSLDRRD